MDIQIIPAVSDDAPAIHKVQQAAFMMQAKIYGTTDLPPLKETVDELRSSFKTHVFLKAVAGGRIVGSVKADESDGACRIGRVIVLPEYQGKGIGKMLMAAIEERFSHCRQYELFTGHKSVRNLAFYAGLGYRELRRERVDGGPGELVHLVKETRGRVVLT